MSTTQVSYSLTQLLSVHNLHFSVSQSDVLLSQQLQWVFSVVTTHFLVLANVARKVKFHFLVLMFNRKSIWIHYWKSHNSKLLTFSEVQLFFNTAAINKRLNVSLFIPQLLLYMTIQRTKTMSCRLWRVQSFMWSRRTMMAGMKEFAIE